MQSGNNGPQANNNEVNAHGVAQQLGVYDYEDSENKRHNTPYETNWLKHKNFRSLPAEQVFPLTAPASSRDQGDNHKDEPDHKDDVNETAQGVRADNSQKPQHQKNDADYQQYVAFSPPKP